MVVLVEEVRRSLWMKTISPYRKLLQILWMASCGHNHCVLAVQDPCGLASTSLSLNHNQLAYCTYVLWVSAFARSLSRVAASFSSLSWSRSRCVDAKVSWSFSQSICRIWLLLCATCTLFSKLTFSLQGCEGRQRIEELLFQGLETDCKNMCDITVCSPGQSVSLLFQTVLFSLCGLPLSLSSIPLSLQRLVSLFCIFFSQISLWKLLAQLLKRGLSGEQTPSNILQTQHK